MKKHFLFLLIVIGLTSNSSADYLDDWSDNDLCGWLDKPSPPSYMVEEVIKRDISCAWGVAINNVPEPLDDVINNSIELFVEEEFLPDYPVMKKTTENTKESWLSTYGIKPEDLSLMLLELSKETQETVPECTTDFCFTMQTEYATDEILNKGALINALYRHHPDIIATLNNDPNKKRGHDYCQEVSSINGMAYGCYQVKEKFIYDENGETIWMVDKLFPEEASPDCKPLIGEKDIPCKNRVTAYVYSDGGAPMTPDDWLEANGLSDEDLVSMLKDYPSTYRFEGDELRSVDLNVEYSYTDEITNTDQLLQSLLFWDPEVLGILDYTYGCIVGQDEGCTLDPDPLGYKTKTIWEGPDKVVTYFEHECTHKMSVVGETIDMKCEVLMGIVAPTGGESQQCVPTPEKPCIENAVPEPTPPVPIRPGWKIAEGSNFWSVDEDDPYWETEEGSKEHEAAKKRGSWIETEASRYAQENPGVDAPIPSYYATDSCGEGKQEPGASC